MARHIDHYNGPDKNEMRRMQAESMATDAIRGSSIHKSMAGMAEKMMKDMEKAMQSELKERQKRGR